MSENIHKLSNAIIPGSGPNKSLIEDLTAALKAARAGEIVTGGWRFLYANDHIGTGWSYGQSRYWGLSAAIARLYHKFVQEALLNPAQE